MLKLQFGCVQGEVFLDKSFECRLETVIMLILGTPVDEYVVTDILDTRYALQSLTYGVLKNLSCRRDSKVQSFIPSQSNMGTECVNVARPWG